MMEPLVLSVLILAVLLAVTLIVTFVVAVRADHAATIRGPMATLDELERRIATRRETLTELDEDLAKRREALANVAEMQAEVDALVRQRDEVLSEHAQLAERREEVAAMRRETEEAHGTLAEARRELDEVDRELAARRDELDHAKRVAADVETLTERRRDLEDEVRRLREQAVELDGLVRREAELRDRAETLERDLARREGEAEASRNRRHEAEAAAKTAEAALADRRAELETAAAEAQVARHESRRLAEETETAEAKLRSLHAEAETLKALIAQASKEAPRRGEAGAEPAGDPLDELKTHPPVLRDLSGRETRARETEAEALQRVASHLKNLGLDYPRRVLHAFHTAMKVNDTTQMAVLAGISGTGKSQLPRRYAEAMGIGFLQVSVQPRWDSPQDLMGFYNYIEGRFRPTDMARALYHLDAWNGPEESRELQDRMLLVLLDEMNLARVEYYFSDFLSRLENRPPRGHADKPEARKDAELELDMPVPKGQSAHRIFPGYNVLFAGTMNEDESTQSLSDKVVDRANLLRFAAPKTIATPRAAGAAGPSEAISRKVWEAWLREPSTLGGADEAVGRRLERLVELMRGLGRPIGHRLGRAIMAYVANYPREGERPAVDAAIADQVEMRLLPKLRGVEVELAGNALEQLRDFVERDLSDPVLAQAITDSVDASRDTGQFAWRGVGRE